jgi:putative tricarboxylic transport membrane protein
MEAITYLLMGFKILLTPVNLLCCFMGVSIGTLIGVLPGIGSAGTIAILLPFTYTLDPTSATIMIVGIYYGSQYGGSTTSILVNIPGEIGSIVTCLDGYQMARKGRAGPALGISAMGSFIGGTLGIVGLMFLVPPLSKLAMSFGPPEMFSLILFGLLMISSLGGKSLIKALLIATAGIFASCVGKEEFSGFSRFTLGSFILSDGLGLPQVAMGLFGISEVLATVESMEKQDIFKTELKGLFPTLKDWLACKGSILRGTIVGFFLGIIPGAGFAVTTFFAYWLEKRVSKYPEKFGTGVIEGVAAPETANNACAAGSMIPLFSLGVPTMSSMALLLGAFIIHGIQPGPLFISQYPNLFWGVIASMFIGNAMLLILNLPLIGIWVRVLKIPYFFLFPLIILFCFVGVYSLNNNAWDIVIMTCFGVIGYLFRKLDYPLTPFILGLVLGPMMETGFRQTMGISEGDFRIFMQRPIAAVLLSVMILTIAISLILKLKKKVVVSQEEP